MLFTIDVSDQVPVYLQIAAQVRQQIIRTELKPGDELPSVRDLASSLGINMHTARHAYMLLRDQGLLSFRLGQQARVAKLSDIQPASEAVNNTFGRKLRELITEALLMGITAEEFRRMTDKEIKDILRGKI